MRLALLTLIAALTAGSLSATPVSLEINPTASVRGNVVRVGDVAQIVSGTDPGVLQVELVRTPNPGAVVRLTRARIRGTLAAHGFDAKLVRVRGARAAVVSPEVTRLDPTALRSLAARFLREELAERFELAAAVNVSVSEEPWIVPIGRERSALHVRWLVQPGPQAPSKAHLEVVVTLDGQERAVRTLSARIQLPKQQPAKLPPVVTAKPAPATRRAAAPISTAPPTEPTAVFAGQRVRTRVRVGALTVYSEGIAVADAPLDGAVGVQVATGPIREGRVVSAGVVEIVGVGASQ